MEKNPFPDLKIESSDFLDAVKGRSKCSKCNKSRKYYCYTCYLPIPELTNKVPRVKLPLKVDIIKHPSEVDGKSTAVHAGVIAPDDVTIYTYPVIPDYKNKDRVAVVFPGENSLSLTQLAEKHRHNSISENGAKWKRKRKNSNDGSDDCIKSLKTEESQKATEYDKAEQVGTLENAVKDKDIVNFDKTSDNGGEVALDKANKMLSENGVQNQDDWSLERVIFIDSTWNQTRSIFGDERLKDLQCIQLGDRKTKFWRHHKDNPETYLSTIEAIYYFIHDFHEIFVSNKTDGEYDNLLFFFSYMYGKIRHLYDGGDRLLAYKKKQSTADPDPT